MNGLLRGLALHLLRALCIVKALAGATSIAQQAQTPTWHAAAIAAQVPGGGHSADTRRIYAALWVNTFADVATLHFASQGGAGVSQITLRCAAAGSNGPAVWSSGPITSLSGVNFQLLGKQLAIVPASSACPTGINNVASLEAAAQRRMLYLDLERSSAPLRGQLWPRSFELQESGFGSLATASDQQVVAAAARPPQWLRASATLWFSEFNQTLAHVGYTLPNRHRFRSARLHCAPPGEDGPVVAELLADEGVLTQTDVLPVADAGPCGMAVNGTASLLEALARGNLYVELELADPAGARLRGQFAAP